MMICVDIFHIHADVMKKFLCIMAHMEGHQCDAQFVADLQFLIMTL